MDDPRGNFERMLRASRDDSLNPLQAYIVGALINRFYNGQRWRFAGIAKQYRVSEEDVIAIWTLPREQWPELKPQPTQAPRGRPSKERKERPPVLCQQCGKELTDEQLQRHKTAKYCSLKCVGAAKSALYPPRADATHKRAASPRTGPANCLYCGAALSAVRTSQNAQYCNRECYGKSKAGKPWYHRLETMASRDQEIVARINQGENTKDIAQAFGISRQRVHQIGKRNGVPPQFPTPPRIRKLCQICGNEIPKGRSKYCSEACFTKAQARLIKVCPQCRKEYKTPHRHQVFCSHSCSVNWTWTKHEDLRERMIAGRRASRAVAELS